MNKFEQVRSGNMGNPRHGNPPKLTDTAENLTFPQLRLRVAAIAGISDNAKQNQDTF